MKNSYVLRTNGRETLPSMFKVCWDHIILLLLLSKESYEVKAETHFLLYFLTYFLNFLIVFYP